jgi:hypothetical protein
MILCEFRTSIIGTYLYNIPLIYMFSDMYGLLGKTLYSLDNKIKDY